jgi:hypothetical protein
MSIHREALIGQLDTALDTLAEDASEWGDVRVVFAGTGHVAQSVTAFTDEDNEPVVVIELGQP